MSHTVDHLALDRRRAILLVAGRLFGERGYHGVSVDQIGAAAGISGPGIYRHFGGKAAILTELSDWVCSRLLSRAREIAESTPDLEDRLRELTRFHSGFAADDGSLIRMYLQEEVQLPPDERHRIHRIQRMYVEEWVLIYTELHAQTSEAHARTAVQAAIGLLNSVAYHNTGLPRDATVELLAHMAFELLRMPARPA